jgi:hypothetical protein
VRKPATRLINLLLDNTKVGILIVATIYLQLIQNRYTFRSFTVLQCSHPPRWWLDLIVVRGFEYARDPESYTSGSVATGRVSLAGQVKG